MDKPKIADRKPKQVNLDAGEYYWCACGLLERQRAACLAARMKCPDQ